MSGRPELGYVLVEHRERLARFGFERVDALQRTRGGGVLLINDREDDDDLARDMTEVLTSFRGRLYSRRSERRRADKALAAARE